jgi:hypothetical protein
VNALVERPSCVEVRTIVDKLRMRLHDYRRNGAPLWQWRELQLEILHVAKTLRQRAEEGEEAARLGTKKPRPELWVMLGEAFWVEADLARLVVMIEDVLTELADHEPPEPEALIH